MMSKCNLILSVAVAFCALCVSACSVHEPNQLSQNQVQAIKGYHEEMIDMRRLDDAARRHIAGQHEKFGNGIMDVTVIFNPSSRTYTASKARSDLNALTGDLYRYGVDQVRADVMPVSGGIEHGRVMIAYKSVSAAAPRDCDVMSGLHDRNVEINPDYRFGCGRDTLIARQIAKPKHLLGNDDSDGLTEGRRAANIIEGYRSGVTNKALGGESASGN